MRIPRIAAAACLLCSLSQPVEAQATPIQDNSFLIEEAYNQGRGVVQHIGFFVQTRESDSWSFTFTQEWPLSGQRHQFSYSVPLLSPGPDLGTGIGDIGLNYRNQVMGAEGEPLFVAPRFTVLLPTGESAEARGAGAVGFELNLPISIELGAQAVTHWNAGATVTPRARDRAGQRATTRGYKVGGSFIWLFHPLANAMLELVWSRSEAVTGPGQRAASDSWLVAPGIRGAINFRSGLQVVPGAAVAMALGSDTPSPTLLLYLSFEHSFARDRARQ